MKKILIGLLIIVLAVAGYFYYTTGKKIEDKANNIISSLNTEDKSVVISGKADVSIFAGKLTVHDVNIVGEGETVKGNVEITGINYFDKEEAFSDNVKVSMNEVELHKAGKTYISDNNILFNNHSDGTLDLYFESKVYDKNNKNLFFNQKITVVLGNTQNLYKDLNQIVSARINKIDKDVSGLQKNIYNKFLYSNLVKATLVVDNNKLLQESVNSDLKAVQPNLTDEQIVALNKELIQSQVKSLPSQLQQKALTFFDKEKSVFEIEVKQKNAISFKDLVGKILVGYDNVEPILNEYFIIDSTVK